MQVEPHTQTHDRISPLFSPQVLLEEGRIVAYDGRVWLVGLVNLSRARLDPVTGTAVVADPVSGRSFVTYGNSINISPVSQLVDADLESLDALALGRLCRMVERMEEDQEHRATQRDKENRRFFHTLEKEHDMAEAQAAVANTAVAGPPVPAAKSKAEQNKERLANLAKKKAAAKAAKPARPAKGEQPNECKCGCGGKSAAYFVPGHDARFKGWLKKIEAGAEKKETLLNKRVIAQYKWVKAGKGERPTTNYKGEPHKGYLEA